MMGRVALLLLMAGFAAAELWVDAVRRANQVIEPERADLESGPTVLLGSRLRGQKLYTSGRVPVRRVRWWVREVPYPTWVRVLVAAACVVVVWDPFVDAAPWR